MVVVELLADLLLEELMSLVELPLVAVPVEHQGLHLDQPVADQRGEAVMTERGVVLVACMLPRLSTPLPSVAMIEIDLGVVIGAQTENMNLKKKNR